MRISFITLFPEMIQQALNHSIMSRAQEAGLVEVNCFSPRDFAEDRHKKVDDRSYGGGPGMVMMPHMIQQAIDSLPEPKPLVILTDPAGELFTQSHAREFSQNQHIAIICGHYEGIDERVRTCIADCSFTIGDFVLTGGELPSLIITDAIVRLIPGVLGDPQSHQDDSHTDGLLGFPLYTTPREFGGEPVPDVLLSGNHAEIEKWRRKQQLQRTKRHRPDLFCQAELQPGDADLL